MSEIVLEFDTRQIRRTFERAIGKRIEKILTELITNADDSYRRLAESAEKNRRPQIEEPVPIIILFERGKRRFSVIDHAEGLTDQEMQERFGVYGRESSDRTKGFKTRSLFGKGLRDVLFTQKFGQVKSIKNDIFYNCRFRWKTVEGRERPVLEIKPPARVTPELRKALRIQENGTLVEFELQEEAANPQVDKLIGLLSRFYMLRMINSSPHREVTLVAAGRGRESVTYPLAYRFPEIQVKSRFENSIKTDLHTDIKIEGDIGVATEGLTQGEVAHEREGGLLILDEDEAVLDLELFGFDDEPAARAISGTVKLLGAGEYIRAKLNRAEPDEVLTETRDGFNKQHPFYRQLFQILNAELRPIVEELRELGPKARLKLSERTRERHQEALDLLNQLASQMLGISARVPAVPAKKRIPPLAGIAFVNSHVSVRTDLITPVVLLINASLVAQNDIIEVRTDKAEIIAEPSVFSRGDDPDEAGVVLKIIRLRCATPGLVGNLLARWKDVEATIEITTIEREILTPVDGLEFERDQANVRVGADRRLRLFVDVERIPVGSEIALFAESAALEIRNERVPVEQNCLITPKIAELGIYVRGNRTKASVTLSASHSECVAGIRINVVEREKKERGKQGLFRDYRFQPLERKVQTQWLPDGYVLINTQDPVNARYFGDDPGMALEQNAHCQVRLADLILNECLQIMVSQALESGRLDRRFPNNPEIDVRNYVDEKKFEIGSTIHEKFVTNV